MDNKKKIMIVLSVAILVLIVIGSSYAYFVVGVSERAERSIRVTTSTTDTLLFEMGSDITFKATQSEFVESGNNATGKTTAKAILKANNETNRAIDHYYFYLDINKNDFVYTSEEQTAELILTIKKPDNTYVTTIDGLEYVTVGSVSGFDITESTDLIKIVENKEIVATSANNNTTEEEWELTITFVNLDNNQNENAGKTFEAKMIMQKEKINNLFADYIKNLYTSDGVNGLYLHDSDLANGANDNSLRYAGGDYTLTSKAINAGYNNLASTVASSSDNLIYQNCNTIGTMLYCIKPDTYYNVLRYDTTNTHYDTLDKALDKAVTDGYLSNGNINNFVCFGSDESTCPSDNLYRIVGVFGNHVKLIKYDKADSILLGTDGAYSASLDNEFRLGTRGSNPTENDYYPFSNNFVTINGKKYYNIWSKSELNKINLNTNYLNNIGDKWRSLITGHKYIVGGFCLENDETEFYDDLVSTIMNKEINNPDTSIETYYKGRVGLMYINDFIYSFNKDEWSKTFANYRSLFTNNWLDMGYQDNSITRDTYSRNTPFGISNAVIRSISGRVARPAFYLSSGAIYVSGNGTKTNPYRIN